MRIRTLSLLFVIFLSACGVSLAEDVPPPENFAPTQAAAPETSNTAAPAVPPDPERGAPFYAESCLPCHGSTGLGDGPQAADLSDPVIPIGSVEVARTARPVDWYQVFSQGNIAHSMPGFASSLDNRQRWDVLAYIYTLSMDDQLTMMGEALYEEYCLQCHGQQGQGVVDGAPDWSDPAALAALSGEEINAALSANMGGTMPSFEDTLSEAQRWAVVDYVRTLGFASPPLAESAELTPAAGPQPEMEAQEAPESPGIITISGRVVSLGDEPLPVDEMNVTLQGFEGMQQALVVEGQVAPDGTFIFEDVDAGNSTVFMVLVESGSAGFVSDPIHASDFVDGVYEEAVIEWASTITDPSVLQVPRLHVFFDFSQPGMVQVVQLWIMINPTNSLVMPPDAGTPLLEFALPADAQNLQFDDTAMGDKVVMTEDGFGLSDGIEPFGQRQFLYAYDQPYEPEGGLFKTYRREITFDLPLAIDEALVMVPVEGVEAEADWLAAAGTQDMQGMVVQLYSGNALPAGSADLALVGRPSGGASGQAANKMNSLLIGAAALGLVLVGAGLWIYRMQLTEEEETEEGGVDADDAVFEREEDVLDAILALEDQHGAGELPDEVYQRRRAALKARLRQLREGEEEA